MADSGACIRTILLVEGNPDGVALLRDARSGPGNDSITKPVGLRAPHHTIRMIHQPWLDLASLPAASAL